jgi:hypothetical protein
MSLRFFHIVFIALATLLAAVTGVWSLDRFGAAGGGGWLALGVACLAAAAALVVYGLWFVRKTRGESLL